MVTQGASPDTTAAAVYTSLKRRLGIMYARYRLSESTEVAAKNAAAPAPRRYLDATDTRKMLDGRAAATPPCRRARLPVWEPFGNVVNTEGAKGASRFAACRNIIIASIPSVDCVKCMACSNCLLFSLVAGCLLLRTTVFSQNPGFAAGAMKQLQLS